MSGRPSHDSQVGETCECFRCHIGSLTLGLPKDFPSKTYSKAEPKHSDNSYAKGVPVSHRPDGSQMPYIRSSGEIIYQREFDKKSHLVKENMQRLEQSSPAHNP